MAEIDTCADCYVHAHTKRETWFLEPCRRPHLLLWAKLKVLFLNDLIQKVSISKTLYSVRDFLIGQRKQ